MSTSRKEKSDLSAHFLDANNTVFNQEYFNYLNQKNHSYSEKANVLGSNKNLITAIAHAIEQAGQGEIGSFSVVQDPVNEKVNMGQFQRPSFFNALSIMHAELQAKSRQPCKFDKYLMWDAWTRNEAGKAFHFISEGSTHSNHHCPIDYSKVSILYAKMQRIVAENPDKQNIHVTVWDDDINIIQELEKFLSSNAKLIPEKVTLHFMHHKGTDTIFVPYQSPIKGQGQPNPLYEATIRALYNSPEYDTFAANQYSLKNSFFSECLLRLHERALDFAAILKKLNETENLSLRQAFDQKSITLWDDYHHDMLAAIPIRALLDFCKKEKRINRSKLAEIMAEKIKIAKTPTEAQSIINILCLEEYRVLLHDRVGRVKWSLINHTWQNKPISTTFNHLIKMAKCKMLELYAKDKFDQQGGQEVNQGYSFSQDDRQFLQKSRHWAMFGNSRSFLLFNNLKQVATRDKARQIIAESLDKHYQAVKKRQPI